ncbi:MAG: CDP-archaeol synthase, partial [Jaaginema sp. PMC 1079.18]|nr:CDP-archaeol synthase [Jaaginema sp. PMC 1079.18]
IISDVLIILGLGLILFLAGVWEALLWRTSWFQFCNYPIQAHWFGKNKKWRGLITLPLTHLFIVILLRYIAVDFLNLSTPFASFTFSEVCRYGLLVGLVFNLSELPNSFLKRRLNIPAGDESHWLFCWCDRIDSTYGTLLLLYFYFHFPGHLVGLGLAISPFLFMGTTWVRRQLGLKK